MSRAELQLLLRQAPRCLIFFANGYGDHFLALPTMRALSKLCPGRLTLVCAEDGLNELWSALPLKSIMPIKINQSPTGRSVDDSVNMSLFESCDFFISLVPWKSPSLTAFVRSMGPSDSVGFDSSFDTAISLDYSKHSADLCFDVVRLFLPDARLADYLDPPVLPVAAHSYAQEIMACLPPHALSLCIHMDTLLEKMWNREELMLTIKGFLDCDPNAYIFLLGWDDPYHLAELKDNRVIPLFRLQFFNACAVLASSGYFLGIDSCLLHVADLFRVPSVGLFGPTSYREFGFLVCRHSTFQAGTNMNLIRAGDVLEELSRLVEGARNSRVIHVGPQSI